jgi:hypothetical protein
MARFWHHIFCNAFHQPQSGRSVELASTDPFADCKYSKTPGQLLLYVNQSTRPLGRNRRYFRDRTAVANAATTTNESGTKHVRTAAMVTNSQLHMTLSTHYCHWPNTSGLQTLGALANKRRNDDPTAPQKYSFSAGSYPYSFLLCCCDSLPHPRASCRRYSSSFDSSCLPARRWIHNDGSRQQQQQRLVRVEPQRCGVAIRPP